MPDVTLSTDIDAFLKTADDAAARTELGLGTAAEAATGDFATAAEGILAGTALQPADPTLATVTSNGATTASNITVGGRLATGNNTAVGANSTAIGGIGNSATGSSSEVLGGDVSTASGTGGTVVGGSNITNRANWTATLGGLNHDVLSSANRGAIVGGYDNHLNHADSIILGGNNIITDAANTVFVPNLKVDEGFKMPTGATDTYVLTTDANGVGTWQAAAGGGGQVDSVVAGTNVTIDNTDPINPIINAAGGGQVDSVVAGTNITIDNTDPINPIINAAGGGGGSSVVASFVDNSFEVNKPSSADVVVPVTQMAYEMQAGTTYYVKMFIALESLTFLSGGNYTITPLILSHTPWAATAGVKKGFIGTNWLDTGVGSSNQIYSSRDSTYVAAGYDASASSTYIISPDGYAGYGGWAKVEGMITAPSTATFTPTLSIVGGGGPTGSLTVSFQGMIMEMP
jgi:hypothetical protein